MYLFLFWLVPALLGVAILVWSIHRYRLVLHPHQYLEYISFTEWRAERDIKMEIEQAYDGWLSDDEFYLKMQNLEDDGLVEHRDVRRIAGYHGIRYSEFKRKMGGNREWCDTEPNPTSELHPA